MKFKMFLTLMCCVLLMLFVQQSWSQLPTDVEDVSIAFGFDRIIDDAGWNVLAAVPYEVGVIDGHAALILQSGDVIRGKYHAEASMPVGDFGVTGFTFGTIKGYGLNDLGRESNIGIGVDTPDIAGASVRIGIFGKNAGPFGHPSARSVLEANNFAPADLDGLGLEIITPPPEGLNFKTGNMLNGLVAVNFAYRGVSFSVKGMPELTGEGVPAHQAIVSAHVSRDMGNNLSLEFGGDIGFQWWNNQLERELAYFAAIGINF